MIYDAKGNQWRTERQIGFHGHDQIEADVRAEVKGEPGRLPDFVVYERSDDLVAARKSR